MKRRVGGGRGRSVAFLLMLRTQCQKVEYRHVCRSVTSCPLILSHARCVLQYDLPSILTGLTLSQA
jgi:hypothetical protein